MPDGGSSGVSPRFLKIGDMASELATSESQLADLPETLDNEQE